MFPSLEPGGYTLTIEKAGFRTDEQKGIALQTGERVALGTVGLTLGAVTETVSVTAEAEHVKTESAERSGNITSTQVDKLLLFGRNVTALVSLLPGVSEDLGATNSASLDRNGGGFNVQGARNTQNNISLDGINSTDSDNGVQPKMQTSADAIAEITVLQNGYQLDPTPKMPMSMNFNIGVQRDIGFGTIVDVAYVGSLGRHLLRSRNLNAIPFGSDFLPANQDPTTGRVKTSNLLRPIPGYGDINILENAGTSQYNSLQVTVNRRIGKWLTYGAAYTYSKSMGFGSGEQKG